jgi:PAS domain S-box-containing protein
LSIEDCPERLRLIEAYSQKVTELSSRLDWLKQPFQERNDHDWTAAEVCRAESQTAWEALENHLAEHKCIPAAPGANYESHGILEKAAMAAPVAILVVDDDRRCVEMNEATEQILGLKRVEILGRRLDDLFSNTSGESIPVAWQGLIADGTQEGICEVRGDGTPRQFAYRAKANFTPGFHLGVLCEVISAAK